MLSAIEKQKYVLKIQRINYATSFLLLLVGWLCFSRLLHMSEIEALLLTIALTILLELRLFLTSSEMVRRSLLNLRTLEDDPMVEQFSKGTIRRLTYVVGGIVVWTVVSIGLLPHIETPLIRYAIIAIFPLSLVLYRPTLQLIQYWEVSKSGVVVNPTPLKFVSLFAPTWLLSFLSSVSLSAGLVASIAYTDPVYLIPGTLCAILFFILARRTARNLVAIYASD